MTTAPASDAGRLTTALLTMDVVDEIRHRDRELMSLAESGLDDDGLKRRLADIYRSQGIEVPDHVLEAGIAAQRERRYVYVAPTGWKATAARIWIDRARIGKRSAPVVATLALFVAGYFFVYQPMSEAAEQRLVSALAQRLVGASSQAGEDGKAFAAARGALEKAIDDTQASQAASRLASVLAAARAGGSAAAARGEEVVAKLGAITVPELSFRDGQAHVVGGTLAGEPAKGYAQMMLGELDRLRADLRGATRDLAQAATTVSSAAELSTLLDTANAGAIEAKLPRAADVIRASTFAAGDAALRTGNLPAARDAVARLDRLGSDVANLEVLTTRIRQLEADGRATGVSGKDLETFDAEIERVSALARIDTVQEAMQAIGSLESMVRMLGADYTYRIVNRAGERSGVWRYSNDNPSGRNHYLVVEALDASGKPVTLPVRNEEDGKTYDVAVFAVRVPEAEYERVGADKQDNGIIEADLIGKKKRGRISPDFDIPTAGGFITAW